MVEKGKGSMAKLFSIPVSMMSLRKPFFRPPAKWSTACDGGNGYDGAIAHASQFV
jgi:hypothetical protein